MTPADLPLIDRLRRSADMPEEPALEMVAVGWENFRESEGEIDMVSEEHP